MEIGLLAAVLLVAANAFFVGAEFSITRLRPTQVEDFLRQGRPGARSARHAVDHIDAYLSATQLGITIASLGLGAVGEPAFHDLLVPLLGEGASVAGFGVASLLAFSIITVAHVVLGELAPKSAAISRTASLALLLCPPMRIFYLASRPLVDAFNGMGNLVLKPFGIPPVSESSTTPHSEDELRQLMRDSRDGGLIEAQESRISESALVFGDLRARQVMRSRGEIDVVTTQDDREAVVAQVTKTGRTRLPLVDPQLGLDAALGVINAKDLLGLALEHDGSSLRELARPLPRVPEGMRIDELLRTMRRERRHVALVADEHGTVTGLITLEDVIEELVGEIDDEFDPETERLLWRDDDIVRVDATAPLRLLEREFGIELRVPHEATVSGLLIERAGRVPNEGETVRAGELEIEVVARDDERVAEVVVRRAPQGDGAGRTGG